ncbi:chemotaxis protein MotB [Faunimonas pinastri]|uniref:Chemotaxis protein MotB n=1 Tax=Faunimonas pinastri TaxID=1855383 RepID=A0A1H8Z5F6_9HYPH|nr:peptidoglycan -binding protein [Faunimonas pinastri]SEP59561.1 chemotaxis protein MotB [Faunimonas pinastri]
MATTRGRRLSRIDYWPGFVDALSTLVLVFVFLITVFFLSQTFLSREIGNKDTILNQLNAQISQLSDMLALEQAKSHNLNDTLAAMQASLASTQSERDKLQSALNTNTGLAVDEGQGQVAALQGDLVAQKKLSQGALDQVSLLNQQLAALRRQIAALEDALGASEKQGAESQTKIADLGQRLNVALAQRVQELARYRSDFFGRLRQILANRPDIQVVGDRFVLPASVLFPSASDELNDSVRPSLDKLADAIKELEGEIPPEIKWVIRVDGHTDARPIAPTSRFQSNWDLSADRAISVVRYLISRGVDPQHLVAAGFGEFRPLDTGNTDAAYARNRRIELKLTEP